MLVADESYGDDTRELVIAEVCHCPGLSSFSIPRIALARSLMLSHWYHHRGQLTVYLRMLDVPLPVTYGATADENPFLDMLAAQGAN